MPYKLFQVDSVTDSIRMLSKRNPVLLNQLQKKIEEILENPMVLASGCTANTVE